MIFFGVGPSRTGVEKQEIKGKPRLSAFARLGTESLNRDLEECRQCYLI